ncbi:hypothetical protein F5144DRAFT_647404 [Chaetomium tenue]|uniref:Uncharacterized protein n=1 Tax=Chaetomium tenue TaxID=1854479 RepID=A0ACB7PG76_9PEZI|nr:hypothetical protein F5144DRAFT_647404 [Chaetomium globosum]
MITSMGSRALLARSSLVLLQHMPHIIRFSKTAPPPTQTTKPSELNVNSVTLSRNPNTINSFFATKITQYKPMMADFPPDSRAPSNAGGAPTNAPITAGPSRPSCPSDPSGAGLGGSASGTMPVRVSSLGNSRLPIRAHTSASAASLSTDAASSPGAPATSAAAADRATTQFPPWTRPLEEGRAEVLGFVGKLKAGNRASPVDVARRRKNVCSFLWHLEFGLGEPTPAVKGYPHRVDEALRALTREENSGYIPEQVSRWAATITAKLERDNWGVRTPSNTATNNQTSNVSNGNNNNRHRGNGNNNNTANNIGEAEEDDEDDAAPTPAPILAAAAVTTPAFHLPPPNHPIWGTAGIMHGIYLQQGARRRSYAVDPRYAHQRRPADVFGANGLTPGDWWPLQIAAFFAGAHGSHIKGIFGSPTAGAYSVVVSGAAAAYHGQNGDRDRGGVVYYSADSPARNDVAAPSADTRALLRSERTRVPVRVLRSAGRHGREWGPAVGIRYDGLYVVDGRSRVANGQGGHFWRFVVRRVAGQTPTLDQLRATVPSEQQKRDGSLVKEGY